MLKLMQGTVIELQNIQGLSAAEVPALQKQFGKNLFEFEFARKPVHIFLDTVKEPMFLMLLVACVLYFILGQAGEGIMMLVAMTIVVSISLYQEVKSSNALAALRELTAQHAIVIRNGKQQAIPSAGLVPGDVLLLEEGMPVPADAVVLKENDLTVNEAAITGESVPLDKHETQGQNALYQGTFINSGKCIAKVIATGNNTVLGKLGKTVSVYSSPKTLLQQQISRFVKLLALFGAGGFLAVFAVNYINHHQFIASLLFALTLAMSAVPEEIPVAFSSFMALGAYKMSRLGIISRQPQVVENLGAVSTICLDKTGTITENKMSVKLVYDLELDKTFDPSGHAGVSDVLLFAALASETDPFDAMEQAVLEAYVSNSKMRELPYGGMVYEYPLEGRPPMMTHVYAQGNIKIAAAKGGVERIVKVCRLTPQQNDKVTDRARSMALNGYRVIGVAAATVKNEVLPQKQDDFEWQFKGLLALYDPPKKNMGQVIRAFYNANINVKLLTGDYPETAVNIAGQVGINDPIKYCTGEQVLQMNDAELSNTLRNTNVFVRMFPEAKLKVIESLKAQGQIVAMTGDGVNDGPALKSASIGIAMGLKGTQIARQAADLVLTDDDLGRMVSAISQGRKIFSNLKKAARYIISIHIPIILVASLPLIFGWLYPNIFTPIHVIFMELIMGPTCSVFFEREPVEEDVMLQSPRERTIGLFAKGELLIAIIQGVIISLGALLLYYYFMTNGATLQYTRTIVFSTLIISNVFLTFADRSFTRSIYYTIRYKNNLAIVIPVISILFLCALYFVPFIRSLFGLEQITPAHFLLCCGVAFTAVMWFEVYKSNLFARPKNLTKVMWPPNGDRCNKACR